MYNQLKQKQITKETNRLAENVKTVQGKTFIPTSNCDLSYLKQPKSNPSLSLVVKSFKYEYDKWKPILTILISDSLILFKLL